MNRKEDTYFNTNKIVYYDRPPLFSGIKGRTYILGVDPNFSESETASKFLMCLIELDGSYATVVNTYAKNGKIQNHISYFNSLVSNFDIKLIIVASAGSQFLELVNQDLLKGIKVVKQVFNQESIVKMNEFLQVSIANGEIGFVSNSKSVDEFKQIEANFAIKEQLSNIITGFTPAGCQYFKLNEDKSKSYDYSKIDGHQLLMLTNWGKKLYFELVSAFSSVSTEDIIDILAGSIRNTSRTLASIKHGKNWTFEQAEEIIRNTIAKHFLK